ncbi:TonB-dependent receptor [Chitinophaga sp. MM2321]|uniref:SusC/RagA family TonB-linked outer membrane protein n=1 Tax=Chitinophaga sp. MM2321 TaxID=3137178 RepID=UPI0032D59459
MKIFRSLRILSCFLCLMCSAPLFMYAQTGIIVKGRVTDNTGEGLPNVSIRISGGKTGTTSGNDGTYQLSVPVGVTLVFSYTGYLPQEKKITTGDPVDIQLQLDVQALNQIVVVGYGTQQKRNVTASIATVKGDVIAKQPVAGVEQALQGQVAGVQITSPSGQPGSGINVQIRGSSAISSGNTPLYVIDGVPVTPSYDGIGSGEQKFNPLNTINPGDIESIDVLKDGAAAAIYGVRASNGVVVITTKRGKGKGQLSFSTYYGTQSLRKKIPLLNGTQWADMYNDALVNAGLPAVINPADIKYDTDWQDEIFRTAPMQNYQLSFSGATEKTRYYLSASYFDQEGIVLNSGIKRYQFKVNLDQTINDKIRVGTNLNFSRSDDNRSVQSGSALANGGVLGGALSQIPLVPVKTPDGKYGTNPYLYSDNPVGNLLEVHNRANIYQFIGNVYGEWDIVPKLTFRTSLALDFKTQLSRNFTTLQYSATQNNAVRGSAGMFNLVNPIELWENTLTYRPLDNGEHRLTLLGGYSAQHFTATNQYNSSSGFVSNDITNFTAGSVFGVPTSAESEWGLISYFVRGIYSYKNRYLLQASMRADGSSVFSQNNRFGYFPAVSLGWIVSDEPFFGGGKTVPYLKIRASGGTNGNQQVGTYARFTLFTPGSTGTVLTQIGNDKLEWEATTQYNAGFDIGFLDNRISLVFDAYNKRTTNLLQLVPLPVSVGISTAPQNVGTVENKGIELGINSTNIEKKDFSWTTNINLSINRNKVTDLGKVLDEKGVLVDRVVISGNNIIQKGQPLGAFYGYKVQGIFQNAAAITAAPKQDNAKPGDIQFVNINGDNVINDQDRAIIGDPNPRLIGALTNTFGYKGLELSFFFQGSFGNDIYNANREFTEGMKSAINATTNTLHRWKKEGDQTDVPRAVIGDPNNNTRASDRFIEKGTYVRLKNLTLAYNLPANVIEKLHIGGARFYITGQNLLTFTNYSGWDPEVSYTNGAIGFGVDYFVYPQARTFLFGLNVKL